jgi:NAD(P)-dependent dehydrogenase (short-subunit alcohol dehydrogenase family)
MEAVVISDLYDPAAVSDVFAAYAAAKTALVRFTETLAIDTAGYGIRVNAVAPGALPSGMTKAVHAAAENAGAAEAATAQKLLDGDDTVNAEKAARLVVLLTRGEGRDVTGKAHQRRLGPVGRLACPRSQGRLYAAPNLAAGAKPEPG